MSYLTTTVESIVTIDPADFARGVELLGLTEECGADLPRALFEIAGLEPEVTPNGWIAQITYDGKYTDRIDSALERIAPIMEDGDCVAFIGECNELWRYYYHDGIAELQYGEVVWR